MQSTTAHSRQSRAVGVSVPEEEGSCLRPHRNSTLGNGRKLAISGAARATRSTAASGRSGLSGGAGARVFLQLACYIFKIRILRVEEPPNLNRTMARVVTISRANRGM